MGFLTAPGTGVRERADTGADTSTDTSTDTRSAPDLPWSVQLHNDPVNITSYVTEALVQVLECDEATAERYMLIAHTEGRARVYAGAQSDCERIVTALHARTLWASMHKDQP